MKNEYKHISWDELVDGGERSWKGEKRETEGTYYERSVRRGHWGERRGKSVENDESTKIREQSIGKRKRQIKVGAFFFVGGVFV